MNKLVAAIAASALLTSCGTAENTEPANNAATTTTRTPRITDTSGRPDITFDPCHDIPDTIMNTAGYNAAKKKLSDYPMGTYTFVGCTYSNKATSFEVGYISLFTVLVGNVTLEEELSKNPDISRPTVINGRAALFRVEPDAVNTCSYVLQTAYGIAILTRTYESYVPAEPPFSEPCEAMLETVTAIEPFVDGP